MVCSPSDLLVIKNYAVTVQLNIIVVWGGTLALLLAKLKRKTYEVTRIKHDEAERIKRLGVYYMCIDDLPL